MLDQAVKRGEKVALSGTQAANGGYEILPVEKVSKDHVWAKDIKFYRDGLPVGTFAQGLELHHISPDIEAIVEQQRLATHFTDFPWHRISLEFLKEVQQVMLKNGFDTYK